MSVVGAFRTGKSFLLSWFLRYLNETSVKVEVGVEEEDNKGGQGAASSSSSSRSSSPGINEDGFVEVVEGSSLLESGKTSEQTKPKDDSDVGKDLPWYQRNGDKLTEGEHFDWRGGSDRHTTGIWMWSEPFQRLDKDGNKVTLLLVDTQGMFDHETTMGLTAAIFGLSTLLSSFQIYNVSGRIQEDNLQQLALFSEYGKMALLSDNEVEDGDGESGGDVPGLVEDTGNLEEEEGSSTTTVEKITDKEVSVSSKKSTPFQNLDFLVRDWPNFDDEDAPMETLQKEMETYFSSVIATREAKDLKDTREQISECFEKVDCFLMTHPGVSFVVICFLGL